jgi:hypothetical protein
MTDLDRTLEQARANAVGYGNKRGLKDTADDYLKGVYAMLYPDAPSDLKTVPERDAWVRRQKEYLAAIDEKKKRYAEWTAAELYMKILFAELDKYRTDQSSARLMDKHHT